jgi:hypothetical protein
MSRNLKNSKYWVDLAMKLTSKDVRPPKCVRDGIVKPIEEENMKDEYIIINKTAIQQRIEELESKIIPNPNFDGEIDSHNLLFIAKQNELNEILSQSTPLISENTKQLQELVDEGYDPYDSTHHLQVQRMLKVIQDYISNLKLDI